MKYISRMNRKVNSVDRMVIKDYSEYVQGKHNDGGCYLYTVIIENIGKGEFVVTERSSCEMVQDFVETLSTAKTRELIKYWTEQERNRDDVEITVWWK